MFFNGSINGLAFLKKKLGGEDMPAIGYMSRKEPVPLLNRLRRRFEPKVNWWGCDHFSRELTILSDGNITTCCVDNTGANVFANIHDHDIHEVVRLHREFKRRFINEQIKQVPLAERKTGTCKMCLGNPHVRPYMWETDSLEQRYCLEDELFYPDQFVLEITARCNAVCRTCIHNRLNNDLSSVRKGQDGLDLNLERTIEFLQPIAKDLRLVRVYNYGEPFLHKKVDWFSRALVDMCPQVKVAFSTNGTAFGNDARIERILDAGIDTIVVSLHGGSEETVRKYMGDGFDFNKAVDNIARFMAAKRRRNQSHPILNLKTVLFKWNDSDEEMQSFRDLAARLGVDAWHMIPGGGPIGTTRFPPGSDEWNRLEKAGLTRGGDQRDAGILD